jgi:predicted outer membrane protein
MDYSPEDLQGTKEYERLRTMGFDNAGRLQTDMSHKSAQEANKVYGDSDALTNRVRRQLARAQKETALLHHLQELEELLEKYPDIARILDLLNYIDQPACR